MALNTKYPGIQTQVSTPMFPVKKQTVKYIIGSNLPVDLIYIGTEQLKGRETKIAVIWFDWEPTQAQRDLFLQFRPKEEAILNPMISVGQNQAALRYELLTDGPTDTEIGKVLYEP